MFNDVEFQAYFDNEQRQRLIWIEIKSVRTDTTRTNS